MIRNYIKSAIRHFLRSKLYASLNLVGLALGLASASIIFSWALDELSFDSFHPNPEQIYRIGGTVETGSEVFQQAVTSPPMGPELVRYFPEVLASVRFDYNDATVEFDDKRFVEDQIVLTDNSFFDFFKVEFLRGTAESALVNPTDILVTETMAKKYFGSENPIGKELRMYIYDPEDQGTLFTVTGVIKDSPGNSHFSYNFLGSFQLTEQGRDLTSPGYWFNNSYYTYIKLDDGTTPAEFESKLPEFANLFMGDKMDDYKMYYTFHLTQLDDIHLSSNIRYEASPPGSYSSVILFISIGVVILLLAGINYINLATAFASKRSKEVGLRKTIGATKAQILFQYLAESLILAVLAMGIALLLIDLATPFFIEMTGKDYLTLISGESITLLAILTLSTGLLAGIFPAWLLSSSRSITVLKGQVQGGMRASALRKVLIIFQYTASFFLMVGLIAAMSQMNYIQNKDLGLNKDGLIILRVNGSLQVREGFDAFKTDLLQEPSVLKVARTRSSITGGLSNRHLMATTLKGEQISSSMYYISTEQEFIESYNIQLLAGRNFDSQRESDLSLAALVNEKAVSALGWGTPEQAIGQSFEGWDGAIIGVVKDFNFNSLKHEVGPLLIRPLGGGFSQITVKMSTSDLGGQLALLETLWSKHFPAAVFDYRFFDQSLQNQYTSETQFAQLFRFFSVICIIIAGMGLYGLSAFTVEQRVKEISVRKVLGASALSIFGNISKQFLILIIAAVAIGMPLSWIYMQKWLSGFAYHINMNLGMMGLAVLTILLVALLAIVHQLIKAAKLNPAESLKQE